MPRGRTAGMSSAGRTTSPLRPDTTTTPPSTTRSSALRRPVTTTSVPPRRTMSPLRRATTESSARPTTTRPARQATTASPVRRVDEVAAVTSLSSAEQPTFNKTGETFLSRDNLRSDLIGFDDDDNIKDTALSVEDITLQPGLMSLRHEGVSTIGTASRDNSPTPDALDRALGHEISSVSARSGGTTSVRGVLNNPPGDFHLAPMHQTNYLTLDVAHPYKSLPGLISSISLNETTSEAFEPASDSMSRYRPAPYVDIKRYAKFPAAARQREVRNAATRLASSGRELFVHHTKPVLEMRRKALLMSGTTRKKYHKSVEQLWTCLPQDEAFCWHQKAKELRIGLKLKSNGLRAALNQKPLTEEQCLTDAGFADDWFEYRRLAETQVAAYLQIDLPAEFEQMMIDSPENRKSEASEFVSTSELITSGALLPVLPEPFDFQPHMMYGNFAHAEYLEIRQLEGKKQAAQLRQLAALLDSDGKELFYYYAFPHIWRLRPLEIHQTVASEAHDIWRNMAGKDKAVWQEWSGKAKKLLGDGNVDGLDFLELGGMHPKVLKLRRLTENAVGWRTLPDNT